MLKPGGRLRGSKLIGDRYSFTSGCDVMRWKRLIPRILISGLNGNTKSVQPLHCPGCSVTVWPLSSIVTELRSFATVIVIGIEMYGGVPKSLFGGPWILVLMCPLLSSSCTTSIENSLEPVRW